MRARALEMLVEETQYLLSKECNGRKIQALGGVERANSLLKAAGYDGAIGLLRSLDRQSGRQKKKKKKKKKR